MSSVLPAALAEVRARLMAHAANLGHLTTEADSPPLDAVTETAEVLANRRTAAGGHDPASVLARVCGLTPFETHVVLLLAASQLDETSQGLLRAMGGSTPALAMAMLPAPHWTAWTPEGPLRRWHLVELDASSGLLTARLRLDERVLLHLVGLAPMDASIRPRVSPIHARWSPPDRWFEAATTVVHALQSAPPWPVVSVQGSRAVPAAWLRSVCDDMGLEPWRMAATDLVLGPEERLALARRWDREAALAGRALVVQAHDATPVEAKAVAEWIGCVAGPVFVVGELPTDPLSRSVVRVTLPRLRAGDREVLWEEALGGESVPLSSTLRSLAKTFPLAPADIVQVASRVQGRPGDDPDVVEHLWQACRTIARPRLDGLARHVEPDATWDDLILPADQIDVMRLIAARARQRVRLTEEWGFGGASTRGLGLAALFAGPSGVGKTLAAEVIANDLGVDLFRVDLSAVVSKYIGETEKNLRRIFDAAEDGGSVLLFDEADALFGKRSEVRDSHDRYANIEVSYLLQRMEAHRGVTILTTNLRQALDSAFLRRIAFVLELTTPDQSRRLALWTRAFPSATPTSGLQPERLARLAATGAEIRSIALHAAAMAADEDAPVTMRHLARAVRIELGKAGRPVPEAELRGW
ncbi:MAG: ATP-binding protein [Myxococcota bacterium]